ncbi:MAG: RNA methyltransferase [Paludibacter sp.]|nr:RNA methyltransferase [Paludibacter sp.]
MQKLKTFEIHRITAEEFRKAQKVPIVIVLDNVRSMHNVGSIFRTCDAFIVEKIVLCGITGTPPNAEIHKTALSAEFSMEWEYVEDTFEAVQVLKNHGFTIVSVEQAQGSTNIRDLHTDINKKYALVFGNEVKGVSQQILDISDFCIEIPQFGTKHSLNLSVAAGIVVWEMFVKMKNYYQK